MNFLLNVNIPRQVGRELADRGHFCRHAADVGLATARDEDIVEAAATRDEVILTHDLDYGRLLAFRAPGGPSAIIFRLRNAGPMRLLARLDARWARIERPLTLGAIVIIEAGAVWIRRLSGTDELDA